MSDMRGGGSTGKNKLTFLVCLVIINVILNMINILSKHLPFENRTLAESTNIHKTVFCG